MKNLQPQDQPWAPLGNQFRDQVYDQFDDETLRQFSSEFFDLLRGPLNDQLWNCIGYKIQYKIKL